MISIYALRTNGRAHPREVAPGDRLRFSWKLRSEDEDVDIESTSVTLRQVANRSTEEATVWTSAAFTGSPTALAYTGPDLEATSTFEWTVTVNGSTGWRATSSSRFETAFPIGEPWRADWIRRDPTPWFDGRGVLIDQRPESGIARSWQMMYATPPARFRREFELEQPVVRARIFTSAKGVYRAFLNGSRVGDLELAPGWTDYRTRIEYQGYDVTALLAPGRNVWGAVVADGWYSGFLGYNTRKHAEQYGVAPEFTGILVVDLADGSRVEVTTDGEWAERAGSLAVSDLLMGEYHEHSPDEGWTDPPADTRFWRAVAVSAASDGVLRPQMAEPMRVVRRVAPISVIAVDDGTAIVDFGQNLVGRVGLQLRGQARGDVVTVRHGEMLDGERLYTANLRSAEAKDSVVCAGRDELFEPLFTLHGFRFAEVNGLRGPLDPESVHASVISSDLDTVGEFATSSELVDRLYANIVWGQRGNFVSVPTDCPQRDERLGWTADAQIFAPTAAFTSDVEAFIGSWLVELESAQFESGAVPDVAPVPPTSFNFNNGAPGWGDAAVLVPWHLYRAYGDLVALRERYPMMRAWVEYVSERNPQGGWTNGVGNNYGDWLSVDADTPKPVVGAAYRIRSVDVLARAAEALGDAGDARRFRRLGEDLRQHFVREYVDADGHVLGRTQTGYLFALAWHLIPDSLRQSVGGHLVADLRDRGNRLTTGFLGVNLLCPVLVDIGHPELAVDLLLQEKFPSWGYSIRHGATTIWERWDGWTERNGFQTVEMNSFNHYSFGSIGEWLFRYLAGIDQADDSVGYESILVAPVFTERLSFVRAAHDTARGAVRAEWRREQSHYELMVEVPPGTSAEVRVPGSVHAVGPGRHRFSFDLEASAASNRSGVGQLV